MATVMPDLLLDTTSLICPLPVLKTRKAIDGMQSGQLLEVSANDAAKSDIIHLVQRLKLELVGISEEGGIIRITIKNVTV
ncbi:MAG: sulfurtransferase TusA family protein [Nitrospirae bacterium]|nr:sulfurtransferase TusA family protein [Nitrospirota bacterium]